MGIARGAIAPIAAIDLIGMSVGTMIAGILSDRIGRHTVPISAVALFGLMTFATGWINGLWQLSALRFLAGLGLGRAMPNAATVAAEHTQPKKRALAVMMTIVCIPLGGGRGRHVCHFRSVSIPVAPRPAICRSLSFCLPQEKGKLFGSFAQRFKAP